MKHKVLLTGAFGNVGQNTLKQLLIREHDVTCFDLQNSTNKKSFKKISKRWQFKTIWGDILNKDDVDNAVKGIDTIIHLAGIIPPLSEINPELTHNVNVEGTRNIINAAKILENKPRFIIASSMSVYGVTMDLKPPVSIDSPLNPSNHYAHSKVECERLLRESGFPWMILRLGNAPPEKLPKEFDDILFKVPLDQRNEFISPNDVGIALANAVTLDEINKVFLIGGGKGCQLKQRDFLRGLFDIFGLKMLPNEAFKIPTKKEDWFYIDWLDTTESQEALKFQTETFQQYVERIKRRHRLRRLGIKIISPLAKRFILRKSPYYKASQDTIT